MKMAIFKSAASAKQPVTADRGLMSQLIITFYALRMGKIC
jgi:hypothetical protein